MNDIDANSHSKLSSPPVSTNSSRKILWFLKEASYALCLPREAVFAQISVIFDGQALQDGLASGGVSLQSEVSQSEARLLR